MCMCVDGVLRFASYYKDHMVLQKSPERAVVWGYGSEGSQVKFTLSGQHQQKISQATVTNDPVEAGGPYNVTVAVQNITAVLTDVLFGDVWLCGGQSNMLFEVYKIFNASEELKRAAHYPHVRTFMASLAQSKTEQTDLIDVQIPWSVPPLYLAGFSAVCWLFGRDLYDSCSTP
ncbi:hypothetical protein F7725_020975 [Dissostichus mawsoni]|uniref:Sialate O-acetylesterase n=1 Tax=Dissostichus mawsoni TaxID=36200 RepID=A0A7J5YHG6_DISMA|nr:hypothetical protein F7725_020975 [Dissostichus mawsoni]